MAHTKNRLMEKENHDDLDPEQTWQFALVKWIRKEVSSILKDPISMTVIWLWLSVLLNNVYKDHSAHEVRLSPQVQTEMVISWKLTTLTLKIEKIIYDETLRVLKEYKFNDDQAKEIASWLIKKIAESWLLEKALPKPKPQWLTALFALIYIYLYTKTIRNIKETHNTVSTLSFGWFSVLNWWFAISNWIFDAWSLWYLSAWIMWVITVAINEREKVISKSILEKRVKELEVMKIMQEHVSWWDTMLMIIKTDEKQDAENILNECPIFWNDSMEAITWYSFEDIKWKTLLEILQMLLSYDMAELNSALSFIRFQNYKDQADIPFIFTIRNKQWSLVSVVWKFSEVSWSGRLIFWSVNKEEVSEAKRKDNKFGCFTKDALIQDYRSIHFHIKNSEDNLDGSMVLAVCDIDDFRFINDSYWELSWDIVIDKLVQYLQQNFYNRDKVYRIWSNQFAILCENATKESIGTHISQIIEWISKIEICVSQNEHWRIFVTKCWENEKWLQITKLPKISTSWWVDDVTYKIIKDNPDLANKVFHKLLHNSEKEMILAKNKNKQINFNK